VLYHRQQSLERRDELLAMAADSRRIIDRFDHCLVGGLPETFDRLGFLYRGASGADFGALRDPIFSGQPRDISVALSTLLGRVTGAGFDVVVVDQTAPEQQPFGLHTVKVLSPGLLPMSYCEFLHRTEHSPRLAHVQSINPWPHPFA
jgi:ribosomal protein S12 methylthiotransferase accessory factor